jgi:PmbA protein
VNLLAYGEKAVRRALASGAQETEAFLAKGRCFVVEIERGQIARSSSMVDEGLGVRAVIGKAWGFAYTNKLTDEEVEKAALAALRAARAGKPDEAWKGFPASRKLPKAKGTYDEEVAGLPAEEAVNLASKMLRTAQSFDGRVLAVEGSVGVSLVEKAVVNSLGVHACDRGTRTECFLGAIAKEVGETTPLCFEFDAHCSLRINPEKVGEEAARLAVSALGAEDLETGSYTVVLGQSALLGIFYHSLIPSLKADNVQRGKSKLKGKIGVNIASELLTIHDDGLREGGLHTWSFDDEGHPSQRTTLIEKGVLKGYLYDSYTAGKEGVESTGNAWRSHPAPYAWTPIIEATNFTVTPSTISPERLLSEVKKGVFIPYVQGAHSSNPESGEFSVVAAPAWKIEEGQVGRPLKGVMLTGTIYELLRNISGLASNLRQLALLVAPWIRIEDARLVGRRGEEG